jgi:Flp pilus assembly protein TadD
MLAWALISVLWLAAQPDIARGLSALEAGHVEDAVQIFSSIVEKSPDNGEVHRLLALAHLRAGRSGEAMQSAERAVQLSKSNAEAWRILAMAMVASGRTEDSVRPFTKACDLAPSGSEACYYLARALFATASYEEARVRFDKLLLAEAGASSPRMHRAAALNFVALGQATQAERHFREAIRLANARNGTEHTRGEDDPRIDYGAFLTRQGRAEEALRPLMQAADAEPESSRARVELGRALLHLNRPQAAVIHLERAVGLDPKNWGARLLLGKAYLQSGRKTEGEQQVRLGQEGWNQQAQGSSTVK